MDNLEIISNADEKAIEIRLFSERLSAQTADIAERIADFAEHALRDQAPLGSTGFLRSSIHRTPVHREFYVGNFALVSYESKVMIDAPYAQAVDQGSGRWGPTGQDIQAPAGNVFVMLKDPDSNRGARGNTSGVVFAKSIKGQRPQYFIERAAAETALYAGIATNMALRPLFTDE